jgi:hypothetical protein
MLVEVRDDRGQVGARESVVFTQIDGPFGALEFKDGLMPIANDVDMRWPMIVRIYDNLKRAKPEDRWQSVMLAYNQIAWVILAKQIGRQTRLPRRNL